jgi:ribosomal protein S18 acetylase RimI-like enzyme
MRRSYLLPARNTCVTFLIHQCNDTAEERAVDADEDPTIIRVIDPGEWLEATALVHDHVEWMRGWTGFDPLAEQPALHDELRGLRHHYATDTSAVFIARLHGVAVGTVAVRCHGDGAAELKRMFVRPWARGRGVADGLVRAVLAFAEEHGCHAVWLETVRGAMDAAISVYRRHGFADAPTRPATLSMAGLVVMERPVRIASICASAS